jgi:hypothetical protein
MTFTFQLRGKTYPAPTMPELSALYSFLRDASCEGNSTFPKPTVRGGCDGPRGIIGKFSYNGRIWKGETLVYDNRVEVVA